MFIKIQTSIFNSENIIIEKFDDTHITVISIENPDLRYVLPSTMAAAKALDPQFLQLGSKIFSAKNTIINKISETTVQVIFIENNTLNFQHTANFDDLFTTLSDGDGGGLTGEGLTADKIVKWDGNALADSSATDGNASLDFDNKLSIDKNTGEVTLLPYGVGNIIGTENQFLSLTNTGKIIESEVITTDGTYLILKGTLSLRELQGTTTTGIAITYANVVSNIFVTDNTFPLPYARNRLVFRTSGNGIVFTNLSGAIRMFVDTINSRVGINTDNPTETLDVNGFAKSKGTTYTPTDAATVPNNTIFVDLSDNILKFKNNAGTIQNIDFGVI